LQLNSVSLSDVFQTGHTDKTNTNHTQGTCWPGAVFSPGEADLKLLYKAVGFSALTVLEDGDWPITEKTGEFS
jgi:hypothetical protein